MTIKDDRVIMPRRMPAWRSKAIFEEDAPPVPTEFTHHREKRKETARPASPRAVAGTEIRLTATPNTGYQFQGVAGHERRRDHHGR
ncbi:MAG: InlB B-repeat-containing protein [Oscillospiraceae bacterium]